MAFFRPACAILLLVVLQAVAQQAPSSSSKPHAHAEAAPDRGQVQEGVYRNPTFGFSYKLPFGWVERTDQMRPDSSASPKSLLFLSAFERPPEAAGETVNSAVLIAAESVSSYSGLKTAADYFGPLTEVATSKGFKVANEPYDLAVGTKHLVRGDFSKELGKITMYQSSLVTLEKGYAVSFTFIGGSEDEVQELIEGLQFGNSPKAHPSRPSH